MTTNNLPALKLQPTGLVKDAIKNSELVLFYIAELGIEAEKKDVEIITEAKEAFENGMWNVETEVKFWIAFKNLTSIIKPVTVDSLKASQEVLIKQPNIFQKLFRTKRKQTLSYRIVRFYTFFTVLTMFLMLFLHIYFSIGTIRLNRIQSANERIAKIIDDRNEIDLIMGAGATNISAQQKRDQLQSELFEVNTEKETNIELLGDWVNFIQHFFWASGKEDRPEKTEIEENSEPGPPGQPGSPEKNLDRNIEIIQQAQNFILIIGLYILPLFYGLLGALTYVLRDLSRQTKNMQYTKESNINHILRLILGTIAGLAVGVFWGDIKQQENFIVIKSLGPLLVAYLSGLTVEYIFSAIERWIGTWLDKAFTSTKK